MKKNPSSLSLTNLSPLTESRGLQKLLLDLVLEIPVSTERESTDPRTSSQSIARAAAMKAASLSGTLALPPGPLGWATLLPDLVEVWRIQSQMVADIAAVHGRSGHLKKETLLFCLFKHGATALTRDLVVRAGKQFMVRRMTALTFQLAVRKVRGRVTRTVLEKTIARSVPLVGALAVGGYAYYDTSKVAATAIDLFSGEIVITEAVPEKQGKTKGALTMAAKTATTLKKKVATRAKKVATKLEKKLVPVRKKKAVGTSKKKATTVKNNSLQPDSRPPGG